MKHLNHPRTSASRVPALRAAPALFFAPFAVGAAGLCAPAGVALAGPPVKELTGIVRDFREHDKPGGHPDFEVQPEGGFGVFTGNVEQSLNEKGKPAFTGLGAKLTQDFHDKDGNPIAPHLYDRHFECQILGPEQDCVRLSYIHSSGNGTSTYDVCFLGVEFPGDGTSVWRYHVKEVSGTALSHWTLWLDPAAPIVSGTTTGWQWIGDDHQHFPGPGIKWETPNGVGTSGREFKLVLGSEFYGTNAAWVMVKGGGGSTEAWAQAPFFGPSMKFAENGTPYEVTWELVHNSSLEDEPGEFYGTGDGGVTSAESFAQWFMDEPGVNMSKPLTLRLVRQSDGSYAFDSSTDPQFASLGGFFPIENDLLGQSGGTPDRNFHFTFEMHATFTFDSSKDSFIRVAADDDTWVFINGMLVIDLGGVHGMREQHFDLNRICLQDGMKCTISVFKAERHRPTSDFRLETNLELESKPVPTVTAMYD